MFLPEKCNLYFSLFIFHFSFNLLVLLNLLYISVDNGNGCDVNDVANA